MVVKFKTFNWEEAEKSRSPRRIEYWRTHFDKKLSEEQYVADMQEIRKTALKTRHYNLYKCRREYASLKEEFGWFQ